MGRFLQRSLLIIILLCGCFLPSISARAGDIPGEGDPPGWAGDAGKDPSMSAVGSITYVTEDKTATSLIRYGTLGFTVKPNESPKGKGDATPLSGAKGKDTLMYGGGTTKESVKLYPYTYTRYTFQQKDVMAAFDAAGVTNETIKNNNGNVYLNHIFQIKWYKEGGTYISKRSDPIYTEPEITDPQKKYGFSWLDNSRFKYHYNIPVQFKVDIPVHITKYIKIGNKLTKYETEKETVKGTKYKTTNSTVPKTIKKDGKTYYLYRSSYSSLANKEMEQGNGTEGKYRKQSGLVYNKVNPINNKESYDSQLSSVRNRTFNLTFDGIEITYWYREYKEDTKEEGSESKEYLEPNPYGTINAMSKGLEEYESTEGIPTTESQYVNVLTEDYLLSYEFTNIKGTKYYKQLYYYTTQEENDKGELVDVIKSDYKSVEREYSYWKITDLKVYALSGASVKNYSLPNGSVTIPTTSSYSPPTVSYSIYDTNMKDPEGVETEEVGEIQVRNDKLIFNGSEIMDSSYVDTTTSAPKEIANPKEISDGSLLVLNQLIDATKANGEYESSGTVNYKCIVNAGGSTGKELKFDVENINNVVIHTPVICKGTVNGTKQYNQMLMPNQGVEPLVLDRSFSVSFPTEGWHSDLKGYGYRDYAKYIYSNEVRFPFDVYKGNKYYPANTWLEISGNNDSYYLPTWVKEDMYMVEFRSRAINCDANDGLEKTEYDANTDYENYVALSEAEVEVSGRLYGLTQYDISNYPLWESVFRKENSLETTGFTYKVGNRDQNGVLSGRLTKYTFPIQNGGHPLFNNIGVQKLGYVSRFYLTTIGNMSTDTDKISIQPKFYYVSLDGTQTKEVDIYYNETINGVKKSLVKVGGNIDSTNVKKMTLGSPYTAVPATEITQKSQLTGKTIKEVKASTSNVFTFNKITIPSEMKTYIGEQYAPNGVIPSGVDENLVKKSVQKWYFEYYLPSEVYVCEKGYDIDAYIREHGSIDYKEDFWLKGGYLKVSFGIVTSPANNSNYELSYINKENSSIGYCNMWKMEGFQYSKTDVQNKTFTFTDGDTLLYYLGNKNGPGDEYTPGTAADDYISGGTH